MSAPTLNDRMPMAAFRKWLVFSFLVISIAVIALFLAHKRDVVFVNGRVDAVDKIVIRAPHAGIISRIDQEEGARVRKGTPLFFIKSEALADALLQTERDLKEQRSLLQYKESSLRLLSKNPLPKEYWHMDVELKLKKEKLRYAKDNLARYQRLFDKRLVSKAKISEVRQVLEHENAEYHKVQDKLELIEKGLAQDYINEAHGELRLIKTKINNLLSRQSQLQQKIRAGEILAPRDGVLMSFPRSIGKPVEPHEELARLAWSARKKITVMIDEREIQKVTKGQQVKFYSSHYNKYRVGEYAGSVSRVFWKDHQEDRLTSYPVEIDIRQEPKSLRWGSSVDVYIYVGKERIMELFAQR